MIRFFSNPFAALILIFLSLGLSTTIAQAQETTASPDSDCGPADAIQYPVPSVETVTIPRGYNDFAITRSQFGIHHTGLDMAFRQQGDPVYAAARGRVTYSDIRGWNDQRGVVVLAHDFPDGNRYYTLYGHLEETDTHVLPQVGDCLEMGDVVGAVGWPQDSSPHLHYEIRTILPDDGGPGYTDTNPLELGWYHPLDFTQLWQARFAPGFVDYLSFTTPMTVKPTWAENSTAVSAAGDTVYFSAAGNGGNVWRVSMDSLVNKVAALPDNRVVAHARSGQTVVVAGGRYDGLWTVPGPDLHFILLNDVLIFVTEGGGLVGYSAAGDALWTVSSSNPSTGDVVDFLDNGRTVGLTLETDNGVLWRMVNAAGELLDERVFQDAPLVAPVPQDGWLLIGDDEILRIHNGGGQSTGTIGATYRRAAQLAADYSGYGYLYRGDSRRTLLSFDSAGAIRWQTTLPEASTDLYPPLMAVDGGCLLYVLDVDGRLLVYDANSGDLINERGLYAGGNRNRHPSARLLQVEVDGTVHISAGYLSIVTLDGRVLGGDVFGSCSVG